MLPKAKTLSRFKFDLTNSEINLPCFYPLSRQRIQNSLPAMAPGPHQETLGCWKCFLLASVDELGWDYNRFFNHLPEASASSISSSASPLASQIGLALVLMKPLRPTHMCVCQAPSSP